LHGGTLIIGMMALVAATALVADASRRVALRWWPDDTLIRWTASLVIAVSAIVVLLEVLGTVSLLHPAVVVAGSAGLWWAARQLAGVAAPPGRRTAGLQAERSLLRLPALGAVGLLAVLIVGAIVFSLLQPRPQFDAVSFHLPVAVQWFQSGNTRIFPYETPVSLSAHYPGNAELLALWLLIPVGRDFLVQLASLPGLLLLVVATACVARSLGARPIAAVGAALVVPALARALSELVGTNMQDLLSTGAMVAAAAFAARQWKRPAKANLAVGGLAAGLAVGTRYSMLLAAPVLLVLLLLPTALATRSRRVAAMARAGGLVLAGTAVTGAYFYVRNLLITGSPVYPQSVPWKHVAATEKINFPYLRSYLQLGWRPQAWRDAIHFLLHLDGPVALLLSAVAVVPVLTALRRRERDPLAWSWALAPLAMFVVFVATPASAGFLYKNRLVPTLQSGSLRYGLPFVPISAAVAAAELRRLRPVVEHGIVGTTAVATAAFTWHNTRSLFPWLRLTIGAALILAGAGVLALVARRSGRAAWGLMMAGAVAGCLIAPRVARHYDNRRLTSAMPFEAARLALRFADRRVAVAGTCQLYGLYGPDLKARVEYLTGDDHVDNRPQVTTFDRWLASLREHRITGVIVGRDVCFPNPALPYRRWAHEHPEYFQVVATGATDVYRFTGDVPR
jgi:hypothetical protein